MFQLNCLENNWYYVSEPKYFGDLQAHAGDISFLVPFWFGVNESGALVDQSDAATMTLARQLGLPVLAIVHNFASRQYGPLIHRLLTSESLRRTLVSNILRMLISRGFAGVNIDFEFIPPEDRPCLTMFMAELYQALKPYGLIVTISVPPQLRDDPTHPFAGAFSYPDIACYSDQVYIMAYDEHVAKPGPIASIGFVRQVLAYALSVIPRHKIRLGMAVYGRDWGAGTKLPKELSFQEAVNTAYCHGASIRYDNEAQEPTFTYEVNGDRHVVWFEDARSFEARLNIAVQERIPGIAVWRLGLEDPRVWELLRRIQLC